MNSLAIIAELQKCSVAVSYNGDVFVWNDDVNSTSHLAWGTNELLKQHGIPFSEIHKIVTISGPGSFTGIRVAQSLCKGLALALNIPASCMSYFELIYNMYAEKKFENYFITIRSEKNQYYYSYRGAIGVAPKEKFRELVTDDVVILGEDVSEIQKIIPHVSECDECKFRDAQILLQYIHCAKDEIRPLYINAQMNFDNPLKNMASTKNQ